MTIKLLTQDQYEFLKESQETHPILTFQNDGYEYIKKSDLTEDDKAAIKEIEQLLKEKIVGFSSFTNFRFTKENELQIRFQYNWGAEDGTMPFTGVGYILLEELLNGFRETKKRITN